MRVTSRFYVACAALGLLAAVGGIAYATIPDAGGVIHGCYLNRTGLLRVIDTSTSNCTTFETPIEWSQTGPQGPPGQPGEQGPPGEPGPSEAFNVRGSTVEITSDASTEILRRDVPAGSYVVTARVEAFTRGQTTGPRFITCMIMDTSDQNAGSLTVEMETPPGASNGAAGLPLVGVAEAPSGGTLRITCAVNPFSEGDSVGIDGHMVVTRVGALHMN
jgi:hypothetical protein